MVAQHDVIILSTFHHFLQVLGDSDVVAPVSSLLDPWGFLGHSFGLVIRRIGIFIILESERYSGERKHQNVHPCLLFQPDIDPASRSELGRPLQGNSFSKLAELVRLEMVHGLNGVHKSYIIEVWMHLEQTLSQVLRSLEVLQVSGDVLTGVEFLAFGSVAVVSEDDDFIDFEDTGDSCDFADEISAEWRGLRNFKN